MTEAVRGAAVLAVLLAWPVIAGVSTYRRDKRQFWRGLFHVALFLALLVGFVLFAVAPGMNAGL